MMGEHWIVTGGAGYIGGHLVAALRKLEHEVTVIDNLSTGDRSRVPQGVKFIEADISEVDHIVAELSGVSISGIFHLAAKKSVKESVSEPLIYWRTNVGGTLAVLATAERLRIHKIVFSSSAAVYGEQGKRFFVREDDFPVPANPYGSSKLAAERALSDYCESRTAAWLALRYFNVAGCGGRDLIDHGGETLFPRLIESVLEGRSPEIYGADYPTEDGTCVRDYVHVLDVVDAHLCAMRKIGVGVSGIYNIGRGTGISVRQIVAKVYAACDVPENSEIRSRRPGDVAAIWANVDKARADLNWCSRRDIDDMVRDEISWRVGG
ncbi:UDP-glucose 4-epimerase GalE [Rathayibacter toxicus]|nr:UDP-glucose 4-epimerase GalE [Rathayibacter toxicus]